MIPHIVFRELEEVVKIDLLLTAFAVSDGFSWPSKWTRELLKDNVSCPGLSCKAAS